MNIDLSALINSIIKNGEYGNLIILIGMIYIIVTTRSMQHQFQRVVDKVSEIDKYVSSKNAVDEALKNAEKRRDKDFRDLQERVRELEMMR